MVLKNFVAQEKLDHTKFLKSVKFSLRNDLFSAVSHSVINDFFSRTYNFMSQLYLELIVVSIKIPKLELSEALPFFTKLKKLKCPNSWVERQIIWLLLICPVEVRYNRCV